MDMDTNTASAAVTGTDGSQLNTAAKWKRILCIVLLFFYFSALPVPGLGTICTLADLALVVIMIPDIFRDAKKLGSSKKNLLFMPLGAAAVIGLQGILWDNIAVNLIILKLGIPVNNANNEKVTGMVMASIVFMGLIVCVYGPVLEEVLYRYTAFGLLYEKNRFAAYAVSALLFGIQHVAEAGIWGGDVIQFINMPGYIIAGLILGFLFAKTKNICVPIGAHILVNSFGLVMMLINM